MQTNSALEALTYSACQPFTPVQPGQQAKVLRVVDGDTITIGCTSAGTGTVPYRLSVRIAHIDTPEMHTHCQEEKALALLAKQRLQALLLDEIVTVQCAGHDKYGRFLAAVSRVRDGQDAAQYMMAQSTDQGQPLARAYEGTKKLPWTTPQIL